LIDWRARVLELPIDEVLKGFVPVRVSVDGPLVPEPLNGPQQLTLGAGIGRDQAERFCDEWCFPTT